jgi:hypothetical protein
VSIQLIPKTGYTYKVTCVKCGKTLRGEAVSSRYIKARREVEQDLEEHGWRLGAGIAVTCSQCRGIGSKGESNHG